MWRYIILLFIGMSSAHAGDNTVFYREKPTILWEVIGFVDKDMKYPGCKASTELNEGGHVSFTKDFGDDTAFMIVQKNEWVMERNEVGKEHKAKLILNNTDGDKDKQVSVEMTYKVANRNTLDFPNLDLKGLLLGLVDADRLYIRLPNDNVTLTIDGGSALGKSFLDCMKKWDLIFQDINSKVKGPQGFEAKPQDNSDDSPTHIECGSPNTVPKENNDSDPIYKINITLYWQDKKLSSMDVALTSVQGNTYTRSDQYTHDELFQKMWENGSLVIRWRGRWIKNTNVVMVGSLWKNNDKYVYNEIQYRSGKKASDMNAMCHYAD